MKTAIILAALTLTGCATNYQQAIDKAQDAKYNRCVDKIHAMQKAVPGWAVIDSFVLMAWGLTP